MVDRYYQSLEANIQDSKENIAYAKIVLDQLNLLDEKITQIQSGLNELSDGNGELRMAVESATQYADYVKGSKQWWEKRNETPGHNFNLDLLPDLGKSLIHLKELSTGLLRESQIQIQKEKKELDGAIKVWESKMQKIEVRAGSERSLERIIEDNKNALEQMSEDSPERQALEERIKTDSEHLAAESALDLCEEINDEYESLVRVRIRGFDPSQY